MSVADRRVASAIGRLARLELRFEYRHGRTVLAHGYAEPPLRIGHIFDVDGAAYMILVCASPGIFAGDRFEQRVVVGAGARVLLASQSALQVHPGDGGQPAAIQSAFDVAEGGELHCLWDPVIPFADARLLQRYDVRVAADSRLYWSDALMSGRASRGETWRFSQVDHELRLTVGTTLRYLERYRLRPDACTGSPWIVGDNQYVGTMLVHHAAATSELARRFHDELAGIEGVSAAVDLVEPQLMVGRIMSAGGAAFARGRAAFRDSALDAVFANPRLVPRR
jgi:urease accessory protein